MGWRLELRLKWIAPHDEESLGIGEGYAASDDHLVAKMVVGVPL